MLLKIVGFWDATANIAEFERNLISERTRDALAALKADGVRLGRPPEIDAETESYVAKLREEGEATM